MKKMFFMLVLLTLLISACGAAPETTTPEVEVTEAAEGSGILAVCLPALDNPLMLAFQDAFTNAFGANYDVQVSSADSNANTQASQIENYTTSNAEFMFVMPVESTSLVPALVAAKEAGVMILIGGTDPGDPDAYTAFMHMNQYLGGYYAAYMAKLWVDENYPDAEAGSVPTVIFESTLNPEAVDRSTGLKMISEPYMKDADGSYIDAEGNVVTEAEKVDNPAYSPAVDVVTVVQAEMFQAGQTAMQNVLTTNPDVKLVIAYAGDGGMGASQAIVDEFAKGAGVSVIDDLSKVAVFGVGMIGAEGQAVIDASNGTGVFRGTVQFGGDLIGRTIEIAGQMMSGEDVAGDIWDDLALITAIDGQMYRQAVESATVFTVPTGEPEAYTPPAGPPP